MRIARLFLATLGLLVALTGAVFLPALAPAQTPAASYATLDRLRETVIAEGARFDPAQRDAMLKALEAFVLQPPYDRNPDAVRHFRAMCDHAIGEIAAEQGDTPGVKIWKFYSSAYVCRSGRTVFAFDLNQGVNAKRWTPSGAPGWAPPPKTGADFVMTDAQIARLAGLIDVAFYSHEDEDHVCHAFMDALVKAGKTVVVTAPVLRLPGYGDLAARLTVLTPETGKTYHFGALTVEGLATWQTYANPARPWVANNIYLVTTPTGLVLMHKGDANVGDEAWNYFAAYQQRGGKIDLYLGGYSPFGTKDKDPTGCAAKIHQAFDDFVIPGHMYEWSHLAWGVKGLLTYDKVMGFDGERIRQGRGLELSWGECHACRSK
jgi:L-ascorbate metabolism protein UlaG (beta-lactamase superfamily)